MGMPYSSQVAQKDAAARALIGERLGLDWLAPAVGPESSFRTKAKMVIGGTVLAAIAFTLAARHRRSQPHSPRLGIRPLA